MSQGIKRRNSVKVATIIGTLGLKIGIFLLLYSETFIGSAGSMASLEIDY